MPIHCIGTYNNIAFIHQYNIWVRVGRFSLFVCGWQNANLPVSNLRPVKLAETCLQLQAVGQPSLQWHLHVFIFFPSIFWVTFILIPENALIWTGQKLKSFKLVWDKILSFSKELTHYQTANFRLFQTERVCRWQFQIWRKWHKVIQKGRKRCGKRRNRYEQFLLFPQCFQKACFLGASKGVIVWEWVKSLPNNPEFWWSHGRS